MAEAAAPRRPLAGVPGVLRAPHRPRHPRRHGHQRGVRLHVDAHEGARRRAARLHRRGVRRDRGRTFRDDDGRRLQGGPQGDAGHLRRSCRSSTRCSTRSRSRARGRGRRGRRRDRDARERGRGEGTDVVVVTGDRDTYQLVRDPHLKVLYNRRGVSDYVLYDEAGILERTGVTPAQYPEYAALRGDHERQPPGRARHRREDRGEAGGDLRDPRRGSSSTSTSCRPSSARTSARPGPGVPQPRDVAAARDVELDDRGRPPPGRVGRRAGAGAVRPARVPHPAPAAARGGRGAAEAETSRGTEAFDVEVVTARRRRRRRGSCTRSPDERPYASGSSRCGGRAGHQRLGIAAPTTSPPTYLEASLRDAAVREALARARRRPGPAARRAPRQGADAHGLDLDVRPSRTTPR